MVAQELADLDVLLHRQIGHEIVELEDEAELSSAVFHEIAIRKIRKFGPAHANRSAVGRLEPADQIQKRRFARTRGPEQHAGLALHDVGGDAFQDLSQRIA